MAIGAPMIAQHMMISVQVITFILFLPHIEYA